MRDDIISCMYNDVYGEYTLGCVNKLQTNTNLMGNKFQSNSNLPKQKLKTAVYLS